ncbi:MAG: Rrf2 family transcriptional regulator [Aquabacterium sp.]
MQLTHFTDLGLRVLMYLSHSQREAPITISEIAERFEASRHHLVKVVHFMAQQGWLVTTRGKGGGLALAHPLKDYLLGDLIRTLEHTSTELIDCAEPPCGLRGRCLLKGVLDEALDAFYETLNRHTLADVVGSPTREAIVRLHRLMPSAQAGKAH